MKGVGGVDGNDSERRQEAKRCETSDWPWRGRVVWGCSSANGSWRCQPPLPVRPVDLCEPPRGWRGGSRRSRYSGHYWPERRSEAGGGQRGQEVGRQGGREEMGMEMERVRMGWKMKHWWNRSTKSGWWSTAWIFQSSIIVNAVECDTRGAEMDLEEVMNSPGDGVENYISVW